MRVLKESFLSEDIVTLKCVLGGMYKRWKAGHWLDFELLQGLFIKQWTRNNHETVLVQVFVMFKWERLIITIRLAYFVHT